MSEISSETVIEAAIDRVFDVVTDADRLGDWLTIHGDVVEAPDLPLKPGAEFEQHVQVKGTNIPIQWVATEVDRPTLVVLEGAGPAGATAVARVELQALGDARTHLAYTCTYSPPGGLVGRVANAVAGESVAADQAKASFDELRRLLG